MYKVKATGNPGNIACEIYKVQLWQIAVELLVNVWVGILINVLKLKKVPSEEYGGKRLQSIEINVNPVIY